VPEPYQKNAPRLSDGARKEQLRRREYAPPRRPAGPRYAELHVSSAFSFLDGASLPEDLVARAAELGLPAVALTDRSGVYGAPRFFKAARAAGIRPLVGAEIVLADDDEGVARPPRAGTRREAALRALEGHRLLLLVETREGYRNLCKLLTAAARGRPKGDARATFGQIREYQEGLHCLTGGREGKLAERLLTVGLDGSRRWLEELQDVFPGRLHLELQRLRWREQEQRNQAVLELARLTRLPLVATGGVAYAKADDGRLYDILTCARHYTTIDKAGRKLDVNRERHLKGAAEMARLFPDLPQALGHAAELADRLAFSLEDLGYGFPDYPLPPGETPASFLRQITWNEARARFRPLTARAQAQLSKELAVIENLGLAGYFLIVWDIVQFCKRERILAQGRGSAANSAVCYALSITAVDPVRMELLFERFLSEERGEWPDIDLDLPSGAPREKVIQYVYQRYGPHGAAMTANVITYRDRLAAREVGKALGFAAAQVDALSQKLGRLGYDASRGDAVVVADAVRQAGLDPEELRVRHFLESWQNLQNLPRHLGQHSGGMVVAGGRLDEVVPLEPASMPGRVVVQWDKEDCADLGLIKIDLLGLGMLNALAEAVPLIAAHEKKHLDLAHIPEDDPKVYAMLREADTVGVFQVESRAQMASLPRNAPEKFYDLVIQVAIIRPGPIVGGMVHPFFERRRGRQKVDYLHPSLEPILARTLGVPIFQEQLLRIAMTAAGFTGGEAEELRRAMGFKRSVDRMKSIEEKLRAGMFDRGIEGAVQDQIVQSITSFALYGFPESHAASFALIAYASAYLKAHHPTAFYVSLLNAWPMGFYHPATLVGDAQRRGVEVRPVDILRSNWLCTWEAKEEVVAPKGKVPYHFDRRYARDEKPKVAGAMRLGLRYVRGLSSETGRKIEDERARKPFTSMDDLARRAALRPDELRKLAFAGALAPFGATRRAALWQAARIEKPAGPLFEDEEGDTSSPLPEMSKLEETAADYGTTGMTVGQHPVAYARTELDRLGVTPNAQLAKMPAGRTIRFAGAVIVRQRPGTAKGMLFITLEDETGMVQAIVEPDLLATNRDLIATYPGLIIEGELQRRDGSLSIKAKKVWPLPQFTKVHSHEWH
jgi:error-prone DNA polymerase